MVSGRKAKILNLISRLLKEGMSCKRISICIALGVLLGIFPVLGTTTLLCAIAAFVFRLNLPLIQLVNYAVYPLQLALLAVFYSTGSRLFAGRPFAYSGGEIVELLQNDLWGSIAAIWDLTLYAVFVWTLSGPFIFLLLYGILKPVTRKLSSEQLLAISSLNRLK
jgi:uncharacterized protein (DUF2062 family)